jgi:hypothetical protein
MTGRSEFRLEGSEQLEEAEQLVASIAHVYYEMELFQWVLRSLACNVSFSMISQPQLGELANEPITALCPVQRLFCWGEDTGKLLMRLSNAIETMERKEWLYATMVDRFGFPATWFLNESSQFITCSRLVYIGSGKSYRAVLDWRRSVLSTSGLRLLHYGLTNQETDQLLSVLRQTCRPGAPCYPRKWGKACHSWGMSVFNSTAITTSPLNGVGLRRAQMSEMLSDAFQRCRPRLHIPADVRAYVLVNEGDFYRPRSPYPTMPRFYSLSVHEGAFSQAVPDYSFKRSETGSVIFETTVAAIREAAAQPPTDPRLFWIGRTNLQYYGKLRYQIANMSLSRPLESLVVSTDVSALGQPNLSFVALPHHTHFKYLLDIPGNSGSAYSTRLKLLTHMKRTLFVVQRVDWDWPTYTLQPWVHYVPVAADGADLFEKLKWARTHELECEAMIQRLDAWAQQYVTYDSALDRWCEVFAAALADPIPSQ